MVKSIVHVKTEIISHNHFQTGVDAEVKVKKEENVKLRQDLRPKMEVKIGTEACSDIAGCAALIQRAFKLRAMSEKEKSNSKKELKHVKSERGGTKVKFQRKKRRVTAKTRAARREAINREVALSPDLQRLVGAHALSRPEVVKRVWAYCKEKGMLNPDNRREIFFNDELQAIFGRPAVTMMELTSVIVPHLDYTGESTGSVNSNLQSDVVKTSLKSDGETLVHGLSARQKLMIFARKYKQEKLSQKLESISSGNVQTNLKCTKIELPPAKPTMLDLNDSVLKAAAQSISICLSNLKQTSVNVDFVVPSGSGFRYEAVALPIQSPHASVSTVRSDCVVNIREAPRDGCEVCARACLVGLDPATTYHVLITVCRHIGGSLKETSPPVIVPQRKSPAKWTRSEVQSWCSSLQVPELVQKAKEYWIDGSTLLSFHEEDLRALGIAAPFLLRRITCALEDLREANA